VRIINFLNSICPKTGKLYEKATAEENYYRLCIASVIVLVLEVMTVMYATFVIGETLYLPFIMIALCTFNILVQLFIA